MLDENNKQTHSIDLLGSWIGSRSVQFNNSCTASQNIGYPVCDGGSNNEVNKINFQEFHKNKQMRWQQKIQGNNCMYVEKNKHKKKEETNMET